MVRFMLLALCLIGCQGYQASPYAEISYIESEANSRVDKFTSDTDAEGMGLSVGVRFVPPTQLGEVERELIRGAVRGVGSVVIDHQDRPQPESGGMGISGFVKAANTVTTWTAVAALFIIVGGGLLWMRMRRRKAGKDTAK